MVLIESLKLFRTLDADIVINVQGDEPFIDTVSLSKLIAAFKNDITEEIDLASLKVEITNKEGH